MTNLARGLSIQGEAEPILTHWWRTVDKLVLVAVLGLILFGLFLGFASSAPLAIKHGQSTFFYAQRHLVFVSIGLGVMLVTSLLSVTSLRRFGIVGFFAAFVAFLLLPFFGTDLGKEATRWYSLGFVTVQPSELAKPFFVIFCAWLMSTDRKTGDVKGTQASFVVLVLMLVMLKLQSDHGQLFLLGFIWTAMFFIWGGRLIWLIGLFLAGALFLAWNYYFGSQYFSARIDAFFGAVAPNSQLAYAIEAIQAGGLFGVGVAAGEIKQYLGDAHTDFIIAVAAEEFGLIAVLLIIGTYALITLRSLNRLVGVYDRFICLAGTGLICSFAAQALINLSATARAIPVKGMTLPFLSYGGTSLVATGITFGMLLALTRKRPQGHIGDIFRRRI